MTRSDPSPWRGAGRPAFLSFQAAGAPLAVTLASDALIVTARDAVAAALTVTRAGPGAVLAGTLPETGVAPADAIVAACEALFGAEPDLAYADLGMALDGTLAGHLLAAGIATAEDGGLRVSPDLLWQQPRPWLAGKGGVGGGAYPQRLVLENGIRHPLRPPMREGLLYARFIPWLGQTLSFHTADPDRHLAPFHRWMNDPRVAEIWEETGEEAQHRAYLEERRADPHAVPVIGCFDDVPFGYFELYWAKENRLGPHYEAQDYDRGWHVLVGEDAYRGKAYITAWLPSLMHFMFLDDPRTQRIVGEPKATHAQQIRNLDRSGFAKVKHVDFAHKRALLVMLLRERFFGDRLWQPAAEVPALVPAGAGEPPAVRAASA
ncbi:GNAT family N-acetyltransferase [Azorhizobium doebereinerae]|uniref:GNAT family N-acetyltransferase n=1 Tax=Azorhizobium doebereinerae TaxID=281091 RepID=UPI000A00BA28|nr:GNAT family N-acetyltransferase [Azorhizobium doebereinerae]